MTFTTLLIEDEPLARDRLKRLLTAYGEIEIIGEAADGESGFRLINQLQPDLVFLDIQMPVYDGFKMLQKTNSLPMIIFVTAYEEYAIRAFEENSVDYLLKPVQQDRLDKAIAKAKRFQKKSAAQDELREQLNKLMHKLDQPEKINAISVSIGNSIRLLQVKNIVYLKAEDKYVMAYTKDNRKHLLKQSLLELEEQLPDNFMRIHRACMINRDYIVEVKKSLKGRLTFVMGQDASDLVSLHSGVTYSSELRKQLGI